MERELAGTTIADRYDVLELLGRGGMGAVYRARDRELDEMVALKVIRPDRARHPDTLESFRHEVKLARRVTHVNIARTFELGVADGVMFCTMELIEGESLRHRLVREHSLPVADAVAIARALCDGLAVAHAAGVIHRDIKPDNVLLASDGRVVLADFGVASLTADEQGAFSGTLEYMAPEQARGEPPSPATDVYAVGLVLYEMITGLRAFAGTMSELLVAKQDVERVTFDLADIIEPDRAAPGLKDLIGRTTAHDPNVRIGTAHELGRLLAPWSRDAPSPVKRARPTPLRSLHSVIVFAPRGVGDSARLHVAEGVHQELLNQLVGRPRVRVLPRAFGSAVPGEATVVELTASGEVLVVAIRRGDALATTLQLPLDMPGIPFAAETIANAVTDAHVPGTRDDTFELLLRARSASRLGFMGVGPAIELLERARAQAPDDLTILAELASILVRFRFFDISRLESTRALVRRVSEAAPELAASHVAAGYLELHTGDAVAAAIEFRTAIARAPYDAGGHEGLGRMLLEAGFLTDAVARLDEALAIAPDLSSVQWELARAHALEQNWLVHDELVASFKSRGNTRSFDLMRFAWWRGDLVRLAELREHYPRDAFATELVQRCFAIALDREWAVHRDHVIAFAMQKQSPSRRLIALHAQLAAEAAGQAGDAATCIAMIEHAIAHGLFDLHWLDRCPLLEPARRSSQAATLRTRVKQRADAILDALYGDLTIATRSR